MGFGPPYLLQNTKAALCNIIMVWFEFTMENIWNFLIL